MLAYQLGLALLVYVSTILLFRLKPIFLTTFLLFVFLYAEPNIVEDVSVYYIVGMLSFVFLQDKVLQATKSKRDALGMENVSGIGQEEVIKVMLGVLILVTIWWMSVYSGMISVFGVPTLSVSSTSDSMPTIVGLLGMVENRMFIVLYEILALLVIVSFPILTAVLGPMASLLKLPYVPQIMSAVTTAFIFGRFHQSLFDISAMIWASMSMLLFIGGYVIAKSFIPSDTAHFWWNWKVRASTSLLFGG